MTLYRPRSVVFASSNRLSIVTSLRTLRSVDVRRLLRRAAAAFVLLAMFGARIESLIPDVHDGDNVGRTALVHPGESSDSTPAHDGSPTPGSHSAHVEHCGHSHLLAMAAASPLSAPSSWHEFVASLGAPMPPSVSIAPLQRPPIA